MTQLLRLGGNTPSNLYLGADEVQRAYLGADLVWEPTLAYPHAFATRNIVRYDLDRLDSYAAGYTLLSDMTDHTLWPSSGAGLTVTGDTMPETGQPAIKMAHTSGSYRYATRNYPSGLTPRHWWIFDAYCDDASQSNGMRFEATDASGTLLFWAGLDAGRTGYNADITHPRTGLNRYIFRTSGIDAASGADWANVRNLRLRLRTNGGNCNWWIGRIETVDFRPMVTFMFDDQQQTAYDTAYPMMKARGMEGVISVVTGVPNLMNVPDDYSHSSGGYLSDLMSAANLTTLQDDGWDLVSHSVTHCNFDDMVTAGLLNEIHWECETSRDYLRTTFGDRPVPRSVFVGPGGAIATAHSITKQYYGVTIYHSRANLALRSEQVEADKVANTFYYTQRRTGDNASAATLTGYVDAAIAEQDWLIFMFHRLHPTTGSGLDVVEANFEALLDHLVTNAAHVDVVTFTELERRLRGP